jgi:aspartyl-tRNA(Asn)/glutamyl-tRNA(Gln) amidotransferase subunit A
VDESRRTVRDNALMFQVIARHDPGDPGSADEPVPDYGALLGQDVKGVRIGVIRHFYTKDLAGNREQVEALDAAVKLLAEAGAEVSEITIGRMTILSASFTEAPPARAFILCKLDVRP